VLGCASQAGREEEEEGRGGEEVRRQREEEAREEFLCGKERPDHGASDGALITVWKDEFEITARAHADSQ
jgi:hypothetical protein